MDWQLSALHFIRQTISSSLNNILYPVDRTIYYIYIVYCVYCIPYTVYCMYTYTECSALEDWLIDSSAVDFTCAANTGPEKTPTFQPTTKAQVHKSSQHMLSLSLAKSYLYSSYYVIYTKVLGHSALWLLNSFSQRLSQCNINSYQR